PVWPDGTPPQAAATRTAVSPTAAAGWRSQHHPFADVAETDDGPHDLLKRHFPSMLAHRAPSILHAHTRVDSSAHHRARAHAHTGNSQASRLDRTAMPPTPPFRDC